MDSTRVVQVVVDRICDRVGTGMNLALNTADAARDLYVFSVGASYVAQDPDRPAGEWLPLVVLDSDYKYLGSVLAQ